MQSLASTDSPAPTRPTTPVFKFSSEDGTLTFRDEKKEHSLTGYGDISLSNVYFIPSLSSNVTPRRDDSWITSEKKTPPPTTTKGPEHPLPSVIQKILPPSPSAAQLSPGSDFDRLVLRLMESTIPRNSSHPDLLFPSPSKLIQQPQPRYAINLKAINNLNPKLDPTTAPKENIGPPIASARFNAPKPKLKEKPFRGGKLPIRPPLPRWDLHDRSTLYTDKRRALFSETPSKMMNST